MGLGIIGAIIGELRMYAGGGALVPTSALQEPETGWLLCNGAPISRTAYADLFAKIGTFYGTGDGSTTFNLPDITQKFPLGRSRSGTGNALGATGGELTHTLITGETPSHTHTGSTSITGAHTHGGTTGNDNPDHTHNVPLRLDTGPQGFQPYTGPGFISFFYTTSGATATAGASPRHNHPIFSDGNHSHSLAVDTVGSDGAHNNMPPYQTVHYLIKY